MVFSTLKSFDDLFFPEELFSNIFFLFSFITFVKFQSSVNFVLLETFWFCCLTFNWCNRPTSKRFCELFHLIDLWISRLVLSVLLLFAYLLRMYRVYKPAADLVCTHLVRAWYILTRYMDRILGGGVGGGGWGGIFFVTHDYESKMIRFWSSHILDIPVHQCHPTHTCLYTTYNENYT